MLVDSRSLLAFDPLTLGDHFEPLFREIVQKNTHSEEVSVARRDTPADAVSDSWRIALAHVAELRAEYQYLFENVIESASPLDVPLLRDKFADVSAVLDAVRDSIADIIKSRTEHYSIAHTELELWNSKNTTFH